MSLKKEKEPESVKQEKEQIIYSAYNACEMFLRVGCFSQREIIKELKPYFEKYKKIQ